MGVFNRKGTVRDGLVLELDAANQKSWGGGGTWKDTSGQGNDGTLTNVPVHSQGPFPGAGYVTFDGTGDYLNTTYTTSNFRWWDTDYTIEAWIYPSSLNTGGWYSGGTPASTLVGNGQVSGGANSWSFGPYNSSGNIKFYYYNGSGQHGMVSTETVNLNEWNHIAFIKNSSGCKIFVNGVGTDYMAISGTPQDNTGHDFFIGRWNSTNITGYVSNLRVVKGTALYTSNFTPQLSELTAVPNTKLLTCQKGTITDTSVSGHSITANGDAAAVYNDVSYFDFDGTDQNITFTNSLFNSNQNFTFSVWFEGSTNSNSILSSTIAGGLCIKTWSNGTKIMIEEVGSPFGQGGQLAYSTNSLGIDDGQIHNIVVTRVGNTNANDLKIYHNGEGPVATTYTNSGGAQTLNSTNVNVIGSEYNTSSSQTNYFDGKIHHVCAFQKALTSTEITKNFNALRARFGI